MDEVLEFINNHRLLPHPAIDSQDVLIAFQKLIEINKELQEELEEAHKE